MGWQQKIKKQPKEASKEQPQATAEELQQWAESLGDRIGIINKALHDAQLRADLITLQALSEILVNACVQEGLPKNGLLRSIRDSWRAATTRKQQQELAAREPEEPINNEAFAEPQEEAPTSEEAKENV